MSYRNLGRSGLKVSALSYGAWVTFDTQADVGLAYDMMVRAFDAGVNFFDNAEAYAAGESELIMGRVLQKAGWGRDTYCVDEYYDSAYFMPFPEDCQPSNQTISEARFSFGTEERNPLEFIALAFGLETGGSTASQGTNVPVSQCDYSKYTVVYYVGDPQKRGPATVLSNDRFPEGEGPVGFTIFPEMQATANATSDAIAIATWK